MYCIQDSLVYGKVQPTAQTSSPPLSGLSHRADLRNSALPSHHDFGRNAVLLLLLVIMPGYKVKAG